LILDTSYLILKSKNMNKEPLNINQYRKLIHLDEDFIPGEIKDNSKEQIVDDVLKELDKTVTGIYSEKRRFLHGVLNTLHPETLSSESILKLDTLLQRELKEKNITAAKDIQNSIKTKVGETAIAVWQGDITTLKVDAIVNAANNQMLGCFHPHHACIDNAIHSAAGVQLRDDCNTIMKLQGFAEPTGTAKITRAYNLPSKYVLHTVGPIVKGMVTSQSQYDLASAYISCLELCKERPDIRSIAFCGISTGVFGYPAEQAAEVAKQTVFNWLNENPESLDLVVFNVFSDRDKRI